MNQKTVKTLKRFSTTLLKQGVLMPMKNLKKMYKTLNTHKRRKIKVIMKAVKDIDALRKLQKMLK